MDLSEVTNLLQHGNPFAGASDIDEQERKLLAACHPDLHPDDPDAAVLFKRVQAFAAQARKPHVVVKGKKHSYSLGQKIATGDIADVAESDGHRYILKISRVPNASAMMQNEFQHLATIHAAAGDTTYRKYFPLPVESISVHDKFARRINVFPFEEGLHSLQAVLERHGTLDGRHVGWIFKRLLTAIGFARPYMTRHGAGPLEGECDLGIADDGNPENEWQGKMRFAPLNVDLLKHSAMACKEVGAELTGLSVSCLDHVQRPEVPLSKLSEIAPILVKGNGPTWEHRMP